MLLMSKSVLMSVNRLRIVNEVDDVIVYRLWIFGYAAALRKVDYAVLKGTITWEKSEHTEATITGIET